MGDGASEDFVKARSRKCFHNGPALCSFAMSYTAMRPRQRATVSISRNAEADKGNGDDQGPPRQVKGRAMIARAAWMASRARAAPFEAISSSNGTKTTPPTA